MSLYFSGGALKIARDDGTIKFDSNQGLFHVTQQFSNVGGVAISLPALSRTVSESGGTQFINVADETTVVNLGATDANANYLVGFIRTVWSSFPVDYPLSTNPWREASGSHVELAVYADLRNPRSDVYENVNAIGSMSIMTFYVESQQLKFKERVILRPSNARPGATNTLTRPAATVEYRVLAGYFL